MTTPAFDYIFVGAGAAGCVLANPLSESGRASICVVDADRNDHHPYIRVPAGFAKTLYGYRFAWPFKTEPASGLDDRSIAIPQGKVVGAFKLKSVPLQRHPGLAQPRDLRLCDSKNYPHHIRSDDASIASGTTKEEKRIQQVHRQVETRYEFGPRNEKHFDRCRTASLSSASSSTA